MNCFFLLNKQKLIVEILETVSGEKEIVPDFSSDLNEGRVYVMSQVAIEKGKRMEQKFENDLKAYEEFET